jgi:hypothetical protein
MDDRLLKAYHDSKRQGFTVLLKGHNTLPYDPTLHGRYVVSFRTVITIDEFIGIVTYRSGNFPDGIYGGWYNEDDGIFYIEENRTFEHFIDAITFAYQYKQLYIWDGQKKVAIPVDEPTYRDGSCEAKVSDILEEKEMWIQKKIKLFHKVVHRSPNQTKFTNKHNNGKLRINSSGNLYERTAGYYDYLTGDIVINWNGLKPYANHTGVDPFTILCSVISHETLHFVLHKEQGFKTTYMFDCIAGCMEWYKDDLHAGMPLTKPKKKVIA